MNREWTQQLKQQLRENLPGALALRRQLHQHPERAFQEYQTSQKIREHLARLGIPVLPGVIPTEVTGVIEGSRPGPTLLVREDIDALVMREETGLPFASQVEDCCHACGHDIHTASLLLMAGAIQKLRSHLAGRVLLCFQPAEEVAGGAKAMFQAGYGQGATRYDQVIGFHTEPTLDVGTVGMASGPANASTDIIHITIRSQGGHGAHPYRCADPVAAAAYLITQLQTIISRENPALEPAVLTFGSIHGGTAENIIPTQVTLGGTLRTFQESGRRSMLESIRRITQCVCTAMKAQGEVEILEGVPVLVNDPEIAARLMESADRVLGEGAARQLRASPGSDDFSCFLKAAPGVQFRVGTGNDRPESRLSLHNPALVFDEEAVYMGAAVMGQYILDTLCKE